MQEDIHVFQGIRRDSHPIKQDKNFLWDAHNIRLTTRDGDSMMSITNEKSTKKLIEFGDNETYIGHCVLGEYLVLFTKDVENDYIYRIEPETKTKVILYKGNLGFSEKHPIQAIGDYESELVQKVYWVDGCNSPRVINIMKPKLVGAADAEDYTEVYSDAPFGFVQELKLEEAVEVKRLPSGSGIFSPGVIQYAFSYYHKYGQESNLFHVSEPLYVSFNDRGGSPEDNISTAFQLTVDKVQKNFGFLRVYSILRTSIDATPTVKRVTDIDLSELEDNSITYVDNGTTGDIVDPSVLLYIGGKDIVAGCITSKDNTLFLGGISYNRQEVSAIKDTDNKKLPTLIKDDIEVSTGSREETLETSNQSSSSNLYKYQNQLIKNTSTFKVGETYRLGLQFQYKNGEWSEPLWVEDCTMDGSRPSLSTSSLGTKITLPIFKASLPTNIQSLIEGEGYLKVRPLMVLPSTKDKNILAQGIICPTVFSYGSRMSNSPYAQSSWLLRPFCTSEPKNDNSTAKIGSIVEFRHLNPLLSGFDRGAEIQNMFLDENASNNTADTHNYSLDKIDSEDSSFNSLYYVDQSVLTFHSPDIQFDDSIQLSINNNQLNVVLVGVVPFVSNCGDIDVQVQSVVADPEASGFIHRSIINSSTGARSLISGLFFEDSYVDEGKNAKDFYRSGPIRPWMTHMWHRSGSLNNDCVRPEGKGSQTAILKKKIISNIKFSNTVNWLKPDKEISLTTSELQVFNSNEVSLLKIKDSNNRTGDITYYGNVDSMNASYSKFRLVSGDSDSYALNPDSGTFSGYIVVDNESGQSKIYFSSLSVGSMTGSKTTGTASGTITSNTVVKVPVQKEDPLTGDIKTEYESLNLKGGSFDITIDDKSYTGTITVGSNVYIISGSTSFKINYRKKAKKETAFDFGAGLMSVDPSNGYVGDYQEALKLPKDAVRIKYKSTPHVLFSTDYEDGKTRKPLPIISGTSTKIDGIPNNLPWLVDSIKGLTQETISTSSFEGLSDCPPAYLWLAEIRQEVDDDKRFGGKTAEALQDNLWIPAGPAVHLDEEIQWQWGDTWFQRFDCLKTYPFTNEDINQVVEIGSFLCETRVNIDGRYDRNRGAISNLNMSPLNFNLLNPVYSQKNTFFNYRMLDSDYYKVNSYPSQVLWTGTKSPAALQDTWTNLHTASSLDLDGANGGVTSLQAFNDFLIGFQKTGVQQILFNSRVQIQASDGVPIEIANNQKVEGTRTISNAIGCQDKFSVVTTTNGIYFVDNNNHSIYLFNGEISNLGLQFGSLYWTRENHSDMTWKYKADKEGNNGIRLFYDSKYQDVYFTPGTDYGKPEAREALCFSEQLNQFTSLMSYGGAVMFPLNSKFYSIADDAETGTLTLWENFPSEESSYNKIFNKVRPFSFSFISNDNPMYTKIFDTIEMRTDRYDGESLMGGKYSTIKQDGQPLDFIRVNNEYQDTDDVDFTAANLRKKFRIWRATIPRNKNTRERIRNPWSKITLGFKQPEDKLTILHDLAVKYTV